MTYFSDINKVIVPLSKLFNFSVNEFQAIDIESGVNYPPIIIYFKCKKCDCQYLMAHINIVGEPNKNFPSNYVYLSRLYQVVFDEGLF